MTIEAALYTQLSGFAGLTALVGANIYPMQADQNAVLPYVVFFRVHGSPCNVMNALPTLQEDTFQVSSFAVTALLANQIAAQVKLAIRGFKGIMGGSSGVNVGACLVDNEHSLFEADPKVYHRVTDFLILHDAV